MSIIVPEPNREPRSFRDWLDDLLRTIQERGDGWLLSLREGFLQMLRNLKSLSGKALLIALLPVWVLVYVTIIREGLNQTMPLMSMKLSSVPFFFWMANYRWSYKLDLAFPVSLIIFVGVIISLREFFTFFFQEGERVVTFEEWFRCKGTDRASRKEWIVRLFAPWILLGDAYLFYMGVISSGRGTLSSGSSPWFSGFILTLLYVGIVVFFAYLHNTLSRKEE